MKSKAEMKIGGMVRMDFELEFANDTIKAIIAHDKNRTIEATCVD